MRNNKNARRTHTVVLLTLSVCSTHAIAQSKTFRIAYGTSSGPGTGAIHILNYPAGTTYQVPIPLALASAAKFSNNGEWLVFHGGPPGNAQIFVCQRNGPDFQSIISYGAITSGPGDKVSPCFAPDGNEVVFHTVYGTLRYVYREGCAPASPNCGFHDTGWLGGHPRWSPGGTKIAYVDWATPTYYSNLYIRDLVRGTTTVVGQGVAGSIGYVSAAWSPDNRRLVIERRDGNANSPDANVWMMNADGTGLTNLTGEWPNSHEGAPVWSPDGAFILFTSNQGGTTAIWRMNPDGSQKTLVYSVPGSNIDLFDVTFGPECYANCDNSSTSPILNVADFSCFLQRYAPGCPQ